MAAILWIIAILLVVLWIVAVVLHSAGGLLQLLLVLAVILALANLRRQ